MHPNDPLYAQQWHLTRLGNIEKIWDEYSGAGVHVGVCTTTESISSSRPRRQLRSQPRVVIDGRRCRGGGEPDTTSPHPHGTAVAGILGAVADNGEGIVGVAWGSSLTGVNMLVPPARSICNRMAPTYAAFHQMVNFDVANHSWNRSADLRSARQSRRLTAVARINEEFAFASANGRNGLGTVIVQAGANNNLDAQGAGSTPRATP